MRELIRVDKNGTKYYNTTCKCYKCGGSGIYCWGAVINLVPQYSGVCYSCNGSGVVTTVEKEYTPEHEAKLQAQRAKRQEKKDAERRAEEEKREAERKEREERQAKIEAERAEQRAKSNYVGKEGDRIETVVTLDFTAEFEVDGFYGRPAYRTLYGMSDENGNRFVWVTGACLYIEKCAENGIPDNEYAQKGDVIRINGTIKGHKEYKGEKQTVLNRVKIVEFIEKKEEV